MPRAGKDALIIFQADIAVVGKPLTVGKAEVQGLKQRIDEKHRYDDQCGKHESDVVAVFHGG